MKLSSGDINRDKPKTSVFDRTNVTQNLDLTIYCNNIMCQKVLRKLFIGFLSLLYVTNAFLHINGTKIKIQKFEDSK